MFPCQKCDYGGEHRMPKAPPMVPAHKEKSCDNGKKLTQEKASFKPILKSSDAMPITDRRQRRVSFKNSYEVRPIPSRNNSSVDDDDSNETTPYAKIVNILRTLNCKNPTLHSTVAAVASELLIQSPLTWSTELYEIKEVMEKYRCSASSLWNASDYKPALERIIEAVEAIDLARRSHDLQMSSMSKYHDPINTKTTNKTHVFERPLPSIYNKPLPIEPNVSIAFKPHPVLHFGFVPIGQSLIMTVTVTNLNKDAIQVKGAITEGVFTLLEKSPVIIRGNENHNFQVKFTPAECARYKCNLQLHVRGKDDVVRYGIFGFGGAPILKIFTDNNLRGCQTKSYVLSPPNPLSFFVNVANKGQRAGFVCVKAVDNYGNDLPGVTVTPSTFLMLTKENAKDYNAEWKETIHVAVQPKTLNYLRICAQDERTGPNGNNRLFGLKFIWGAERFLQRVKKYIQQNNATHPIIHGIPITKTTFYKDEAAMMEKNTDRFLTEQDVNMFETQIEVEYIQVYDNNSLSEPTSSKPVTENVYNSFSHDLMKSLELTKLTLNCLKQYRDYYSYHPHL